MSRQASPRLTAPTAWVGEPERPRPTRPSNRPYSLILVGLCAIVFGVSFVLQYLAPETPKPAVSKTTLAAANPKGEKNAKSVDSTPVVVPTPEIVLTPEPKPKPIALPKKPVVPPKPKPEPAMPVEPPKPTPEKPPEPKKPVEPPKVTAVSFAKVLPILQDKCIVCHGGAMTKNGLNLKTIASITMGGNGGPGIKPGDPDKSYIWESISEGTMPPPGKTQLAADEKKLIRDWIASGAK